MNTLNILEILHVKIIHLKNKGLSISKIYNRIFIEVYENSY